MSYRCELDSQALSLEILHLHRRAEHSVNTASIGSTRTESENTSLTEYFPFTHLLCAVC